MRHISVQDSPSRQSMLKLFSYQPFSVWTAFGVLIIIAFHTSLVMVSASVMTEAEVVVSQINHDVPDMSISYYYGSYHNRYCSGHLCGSLSYQPNCCDTTCCSSNYNCCNNADECVICSGTEDDFVEINDDTESQWFCSGYSCISQSGSFRKPNGCCSTDCCYGDDKCCDDYGECIVCNSTASVVGTVIGVVIAVCFIISFIFAIVWYCTWRRRMQQIYVQQIPVTSIQVQTFPTQQMQPMRPMQPSQPGYYGPGYEQPYVMATAVAIPDAGAPNGLRVQR
jgi:hypothetical protein